MKIDSSREARQFN